MHRNDDANHGYRNKETYDMEVRIESDKKLADSIDKRMHEIDADDGFDADEKVSELAHVIRSLAGNAPGVDYTELAVVWLTSAESGSAEWPVLR